MYGLGFISVGSGVDRTATRLVQEWGVSRITAHKALRALEDEGLVEMEPGMGFYVPRGE
jgi:DNA-binding GntR family transcriptional regulator